MDKTLIIVCAVIGSLGVLSAILGFSAEGTKLTPYNILIYGDECIYPQNPALGLGICAFIFLLVAQVTSSAVGGCCGCCKSRSIPSETKRIIGIVCAVVSWIAAVIAWVLLIEGAAWNASAVRMAAPDCPYLKDGIFAGAGVLSLAATGLGITSYIMMRTKQRAAPPAPAVPAIAKGEPLSTSADAQGKSGGSPAPIHQELPAQGQGRPSAGEEKPTTVPSAPPEPVELPSALGQPPQEPLPQVLIASDALVQGSVPIQAPQVVMGVPAVPSPPTPHPPGDGSSALSTLAKQGVRIAARVVEHAILSDNIATPTTMPGVGDILLPMMTDSN